ncbi:hypothetical protein [Candidatus Protofrankia californiensis]|uniref:hypothetical protein n=1 Tax=Candidatus Protofrankia californiensis TaxID=1839754 RepID=UPI0010412864|nr:hypothetical protein [Candidatus Protofrankia californiensis]
MDDNDRRRLIEFHVTPLIEHAVRTLRALIPQGDDIDAASTYLFIEPGPESLRARLTVRRKEASKSEHRDVRLNRKQREAFGFLEATVVYQRSLIASAWTNVSRRSPTKTYAPDMPQDRQYALGKVFEDAERKLRIEVWDVAEETTIRALKINA